MTNRGKCLLYKAFAFLVYALPMLLLFVVNMDAYTSDGASVGFFGYVLLAFIILCFKNTIIDLVKTRTLMTVSVILFLFAIIMKYLADEMILITAVSMFGSILQSVVDVVANVYEEHAYILTDGIKRRNMAPAMPDADAWREAYGMTPYKATQSEVDHER